MPLTNAKVLLGEKEVIFSHTLLVPDAAESTIEISFPAGGTNQLLKIKLAFFPSAPESKVSWSMVDGYLKMVFSGWNNQLGTGIKEPAKIGVMGGIPVGFMVFHHRIEGVNRVDFQILTGGQYA